jgi:creatinine amidohydrolase
MQMEVSCDRPSIGDIVAQLGVSRRAAGRFWRQPGEADRDGLNAHGVCVHAAARTGGIVLPTLWYGTGGSHTTYPWTIMTTSEPLRELLRTSLRRLDELGVRLAVLFTGHFAPEQIELIDTVAQEWNQSGRTLRALPLSINQTDAPTAPDHAGVFETTLLAALWPDRIDMRLLPGLQEYPLDPPVDGGWEHRHDPQHPLWGVMGADPRGGDLHQADQLLDQVVTWTAGQVDRALDGATAS